MDIKLELNTLVSESTFVYVVIRVTERRSYIAREEHIIGIFVEVFKTSGEVFTEFEVNTDVSDMRAFPSKFRVTYIRKHITRVSANVFYSILISKEESTDFLVTEHTPRSTYFEVFEEVDIFHKVFVRHQPSHTDRTE